MKKMKKLLVVTLGAMLICLGANVVYERGSSEDPRPIGQIQTIHLS
ncbi:hypothetical protein J2Z44_001873 [Clostridium punense]|uniref:Phr family secreted Rap phosphatase inhibitor n=1 Tax=Clostridium punense TaxID=1054297 RepID=A0ABS4K2Q8_9CLOT|nr:MULTISPECIES: hypothetical protein [Clostridium]EQB87638.1 hypothetical protein M918_08065 [Clostridium sp. BL8]MBP2022072.1 hypothetical protein [Clostridium punense]